MNLGAAYFAWATGGIGLVIVAVFLLVDALVERYRHRRDLRRWHETCAIHDHALLAEADAIVRQAERRRS